MVHMKTLTMTLKIKKDETEYEYVGKIDPIFIDTYHSPEKKLLEIYETLKKRMKEEHHEQ